MHDEPNRLRFIDGLSLLEQAMTVMTIKSRPLYSSLKIDPSGRRHLLLVDSSRTPPQDALALGTETSAFDEQWRIVSNSLAIPDPDERTTQHDFRSESHLLIALRRRLEEERMGLRLYAIGAEPFLWNVRGLASCFGMAAEEVHLYATGSAARRVFCNHCRMITERVTTNVFDCSGCGAHLFVRDHFSRRINAFAGVQVDAEVPGELPEIQELYS
jgi:dimethylamine monooxygenase subunit C